MKIKTRNGVFETNSSSTHSFTILTKKEKEERKQLHDKKLEECKIKAQAMEEEKANAFKINEQFKLEKEFLECYSSTKETLPIDKLSWFEDLKEDAEDEEEVLREQQEAVLEDEPISDEINSILIDRDIYLSAIKLDVECMYEALVKECYNLNEAKKEALDKKLLALTSKKLSYKNKAEMWAKELYKQDKKFKDFVEDNQYADFALALIKFVKNKNNGNYGNNDHFGTGTIYYCNYDHQEIFDIYLTLSSIKNKISNDCGKELSYAEFAKEFLSDKYNVYWTKGFDDNLIF